MRKIFLILSLLIFSCDGNELGSQYDENIVGTWDMIECTVSDSSIIIMNLNSCGDDCFIDGYVSIDNWNGFIYDHLSIDNWLFSSNGDVLIERIPSSLMGGLQTGSWETYPNNKMTLTLPPWNFPGLDTTNITIPPFTIHYFNKSIFNYIITDSSLTLTASDTTVVFQKPN